MSDLFWNNSLLVEHIILIPSQPVFARTLLFCVLDGEAPNTKFIIFDFTRTGIDQHVRSSALITPPMRFKVLNSVMIF